MRGPQQERNFLNLIRKRDKAKPLQGPSGVAPEVSRLRLYCSCSI